MVTSRHHELTDRKSVSLKELTNYTYTSISELNLGGSEQILGSFYHANQRRTVYPTINLIRNALLRLDYITFLPGSVIEKVIDKDLYSIHSIEDPDSPNEMWICLVHRSRSELRGTEKKILDFIKDYYDSLSLSEP